MSFKVYLTSYRSAKFAVEHWHYSKSMPSGKLVKFGVKENDKFIGAVIFGRGANMNMHKYLGVDVTECAELCRVALDTHQTPVTQILAVCIRLIKKYNPDLKILFSYADETNQGHKGIIYKAGNWQYHGQRKTSSGVHWLVHGKLIHNRSMSSKYGSRANFSKDAKPVGNLVKHLYTYNLRD